jgi:hypothetical protein
MGDNYFTEYYNDNKDRESERKKKWYEENKEK